MHQGRRLQCLPRCLLGHPGGCQLAQLPVHQRQQLLGSERIPRLQCPENLCYLFFGCLHGFPLTTDFAPQRLSLLATLCNSAEVSP